MADVEKYGVKKLDTDNYAVWAYKMKLLLTIKDYWKAIEGVEGEEVSVEEDAKALALVGLCVEDHHLPTIEKCQTAKEAWDALKRVYSARSTALVLQLKKQLNSLRKEAVETVTRYGARARTIRDQLQAAGHTVSDDDVVLSVLAGLPAEYDMLVTVLENADKSPSLDDVLAKALLVEGKSASSGQQSQERVALFNGKVYQGQKHTTTEPGKVTASDGSGGKGGGKAGKVCYYCGKKGHFKKECRKKKADDKAKGKQQVVALTAGAGLYLPDYWVVDSGAEQHVCCNKELLFNLKPLEAEHTIKYGGCTVGKAMYSGSAVLYDNKGKQTVVLEDVLYEPGAGVNLLSVSRAQEKGAGFTFCSSGQCSGHRDHSGEATGLVCPACGGA
jgi:flavodoxin